MAKRKDNRDRAKALCEQAGFNPEELVERPGLPAAPRWLAYIQQANDEDKMGDKKAFVMPQPSEYENSHLEIVGNHEANTITQMEACMKVGNVVAATLCADGHKGYAQPVGGVIAYENQISISGVGFDIACGNMAIKLDTKYKDIKYRLPQIRDDISRIISFGVGRTNDEKVEADLFDDKDAWKASDMGSYKTKAVGQLGTVGSGNHYVDVLIEKGTLDNLDEMDDCNIWIGVHFGSRGFGHSTATRWLKAAGGIDGMDVPPTVVDEKSEIGERYIAGMELAGRYAYAGREWVCDRVRKIIGGEVLTTVHNHHNYAWKETHNGKNLWVVRKGATPAFPGQLGFVGGSMGDDAVIIEGVDSQKSKDQLYSTVHGAGRLFGRRQALKTFKRVDMEKWLNDRGVLLSGADLDESPMAYRRLNDVIGHHYGTVRVSHHLRPVIVAMAGKDTFDPWKD